MGIKEDQSVLRKSLEALHKEEEKTIKKLTSRIERLLESNSCEYGVRIDQEGLKKLMDYFISSEKKVVNIKPEIWLKEEDNGTV